MKKALCAIAVLTAMTLGGGCAVRHTPHLYNPIHWGVHLSKIFNVYDGELHTMHVDIDRIVFGVENYEELETTEYVYSE